MSNKNAYIFGLENKAAGFEYAILAKNLSSHAVPMAHFKKNKDKWELFVNTLEEGEVEVFDERRWREAGAKAYRTEAGRIFTLYEDYEPFYGSWDEMLSGITDQSVPLLFVERAHFTDREREQKGESK